MKFRSIMDTQHWHTMRWVALSLGLFLAFMAYTHEDGLTGIFSAFFLFQAITNQGCMVSQSCAAPLDPPNNPQKSSETDYTEVR